MCWTFNVAFEWDWMCADQCSACSVVIQDYFFILFFFFLSDKSKSWESDPSFFSVHTTSQTDTPSFVNKMQNASEPEVSVLKWAHKPTHLHSKHYWTTEQKQTNQQNKTNSALRELLWVSWQACIVTFFWNMSLRRSLSIPSYLI